MTIATEYTERFDAGPVVQVRADEVTVADVFWCPSPISPCKWEAGPVVSVQRIGDDVEIVWASKWQREYTTSRNNRVWISARVRAER